MGSSASSWTSCLEVELSASEFWRPRVGVTSDIEGKTLSNTVLTRASVCLTLADFTGSPAVDWKTELKKTSDLWTEQDMPRLAKIQVALEEEPGNYAVVVYQNPIDHMAAALLKGEEPEEALVQWQSFVGSLLDLHKRFPDRITLGPRPSSKVGFENLVDHVAKATGLPLHVSSDTEPGLQAAGLQDYDVETSGIILAAMQLLDLRRPKVLGERLEAASVEPAEKPYRPDLVSKFLLSRTNLLADRTEYLKLRSHERDQRKELDRLKKENTLLIPQLHRTQEELESTYIKNQVLSGKVQEMRKGRDYRKARIQELEREVREQAGKLEWLRAVRNQHRDSARELRVELKQYKADRQNLDRQVTNLVSQIDSIKRSKSWRYTRALRRINGSAN